MAAKLGGDDARTGPSSERGTVTSSEGSSPQRPHWAKPGTGADAAYWLVPVLRAVPAVAVGLVITFLEDHSSRTGLIAFGAFALATGVVVLIGTIKLLADRVVRGVLIAQGAIAAASGIAALVLWQAGIGVLLFAITVYAALTGVLELYAGLRSRGVAPARDWLTVGAFTAVAAVVFVLIPPDPILTTGLIGAYGVILGVFLMIAGLTLKWDAGKPQQKDSVQGKVSA